MDGFLGNAMDVMKIDRNKGFFFLSNNMEREIFHIQRKRGKGDYA